MAVRVPMFAPGRRQTPTVWSVVMQAGSAERRRHYALADWMDSLRHHARVWWGGIALTLAAGLAAWFLQAPEAIASMRLELEAPAEGLRAVPDAAASRRIVAAAAAVLDSPALQLSALHMAGWSLVFPDLSPDQPDGGAAALRGLRSHESIRLTGGGAGLTVAIWHADAAAARALDRALVDAVLARQPREETEAPRPPPDPRPALLAERTRLAAELDAADRREATLSQSMTDMARDMVGALRSADIRSSSTEMTDQGAALLADLQLKRLQMASKYQDGFPALAALDDEIVKLRTLVAGEQRRGNVVRSAANPVFDALGAERRRVGLELDALNTRRDALRAQIGALDRRLAAAPAAPPAPVVIERPRLVADRLVLTYGPDPRKLSLPLIALVGVVGTMLLQWLLLRERRALVTPAEVELVLGLPVLRCLNAEGVSLRTLEAPAFSLAAR